MRWLLILTLMVGPAQAEMRPVPRPAPDIVELVPEGRIQTPDLTAVTRSTRPFERLSPARRDTLAMMSALRAETTIIDSDGLVQRSDRPVTRNAEVVLAAASRPRQSAGGGGLCGRSSIQGARIDPVPGAGACGIPEAVRITAVSGVALSRAARMDCGTAQALDDWVRNGVLPVVGNRGGGAVALRVAAGYACRTRNNQPGAKISEHGKGRAIDISGIQLANGTEISVLRDWGRGAEGRILRELHRRACGPFGTVLGPDGDRFHQDHFHFDTARYRSGSFCR
ncbi:hypothetical protein JANAI61_16360 [Jannaschia sp. AI_61]|nr:hypothetical protein JANAI61_16360 [Jannaschia sp. AI_61]